ncbi:MAG: hypothetical protein JRJ42_03745 [Deltaproteobacteria bacterium]|nr:hypothetical protein [Deltaproteobacteria bacterium]MBW2020093.1 hypothetical protein [Deltaproteobacteria bacterium]MBW2074840.1 hypothetical protein [Deltaproteobacteria bacterium]RLB82032.1 MAG: hypothetical protein DRH17_07185 [Deltaproteobacteria bacterium]
MRKRRKSYSVDAVIRFFLQYYNIPTKQDIEKLTKTVERLEGALKASRIATRKTKKAGAKKAATKQKQARRGRAKMTATEKVFNVIKRSSRGVDVPTLKAKTGFEDKKIRNIVFRLTKQGSIKRSGRGIYTVL